jgi:hypothetical protein
MGDLFKKFFKLVKLPLGWRLRRKAEGNFSFRLKLKGKIAG